MKVAFSTWNKRIAPVFDTSVEVLVVDIEDAHIKSEKKIEMHNPAMADKIKLMSDDGVRVLICGAISRMVQEQVELAGIEVIPFVSGDLQSVVAGWFDGVLNTDSFAMPGCCGRRRGCRKPFSGSGQGRRMQNQRGRCKGLE